MFFRNDYSRFLLHNSWAMDYRRYIWQQIDTLPAEKEKKNRMINQRCQIWQSAIYHLFYYLSIFKPLTSHLNQNKSVKHT